MVSAQTTPRRGSGCLSLPHLLSAGDLTGATACLARDACLLTPDATAVHGREAINGVLRQLIAAGIQVEVEAGRLLIAGDTAISRERWTVRSNGVGGLRATASLRPTLCLRQIEGTWKLTVLVLWGWGSALDR